MKNLFSSPKLLKAQERLNSALDRLEEVVENMSSNDGEELLLENEELKEEIKYLMQQQKEAELLKKKVVARLNETIKPLEDILESI